MSRILTDNEVHQVKRATENMLLSPQGRAWCRPILTERGKGEEGNLVQIVRELQDVLQKELMRLYDQPAPVQSRA